jgi:anaerobic selenocysteine-containing dehydrogenase
MCTRDCPITIEGEGEEVHFVLHPDCVRAEGMLEQRNSSRRQIRARIRPSPGERWRETSHGEAIADVVRRITDVRDRYGPGAVAFVAGYTKEARPYLKRLAHDFGSPHFLTESSCCFASCFIAAKLTLGREYDYFLGPSRARYPETKCRLVWSTNPTESRLPYNRHHLLTEANDVPTIVVDPRRTPLADLAWIHLQPRPGTDGALALGMAHVIFKEGLEDRPFLWAHAHGLDAFRDYVKRFTPEEAASITGVEADLIITAAELYATSRPSQLTISPNSTTHHSNGFQSHRAILLLTAITGNLDGIGGNRPWGHRLREKSLDRSEEYQATLGAPLGSEHYPLFVEHYGEGQGMLLAEAIERGVIKAIFSIGMNVMMWPNSVRLRKALKQLDVFSVCDFFETPTSEMATAFFPAATHLEREALIVDGDGRVQHRHAVLPPRGDALSDAELIFEVAGALGLDHPLWTQGIRASFDERLAGTGLALTDLPASGEPMELDIQEPRERGYEKGGFGTPTGKVEFESTILAEAGYDALPVYREPFWSPESTPDLALHFPLVLTSGARSRTYTNSQGRQLETLRRREPEPLLELNLDDAEARGIRDGDRVRLSSPLGTITLKARVTGVVPAGVVSAPHGWEEADVNRLIPDEGLDPISGFPPFKSSLCQVQKVE